MATGIIFDSCSEFSLPEGSMVKNVIIFEPDVSSSVHIDNKRKDILILGKGPTKGLNDTTLTAEAKFTHFTHPTKRFVLSLHYNGSNSFLFVNATKINQFKAEDSQIKHYRFCLGNISKDFTINNLKKRTGLKASATFFSVDINPIDTNDILDSHKYLMKKSVYKTIFELIEKIFMGLLTRTVNASNHTKFISLRNKKCEIQLSLINLHSTEYSQEFHYYPFTVKLYRCVGSYNYLNDLSNKLCVRNKTEDLNIT